jgi:amyloid beta precursor protein binding protein 1
MGQSKAKIVFVLLHKLNDVVDANFVEESPKAVLESNLAFFY